MSSETGAAEKTIDDIADSFVARIRDGQHPSIQEYAQQYPEYHDQINELFPTLAALEKYTPHEPSNRDSKIADFRAPACLADYDIIREIGRGGMGVVYEARHKTMRRRVALKVLPEIYAKNPTYLKRFISEARSAGQLHHTNIVPVFEVGESDDVHFYAMQYIDGQNLDVVIDELRVIKNLPAYDQKGRGTMLQSTLAQDPESAKEQRPATTSNPGSSIGISSSWSGVSNSDDDYFRRVARAGLQVADALQYAHEHGVLHRDIKPSNLILDMEGVVWITDFGLAKDGEDNLTHTGDIVGTLRYMAPERFKRPADSRSDIYSLGLTLYELCTLQHAYEASDRAQLVQRVTHDDPAAPRSIRPQIPRDLETVIIKAIAREPEHRYQTARQLSNDLARFVADKPVLARRISMMERGIRWCRRHPSRAMLAAAVATIGLLIVAGSIYFGILSRQHARELEVENKRARKAIAAAERARKGSDAHLYWNYVGRAQAQRWSRRPGQNFASISSLAGAATVLERLDIPEHKKEGRILTLRNEMIASMCLWDVEPEKRWTYAADQAAIVGFDYPRDRIAITDKLGNIAVRKFADLDGKDEFVLPSPGEQSWGIRFSPDGKYLAAKYHHALRHTEAQFLLWDLDRQTTLVSDTDKLSITRFAFSSDSKLLAYCANDGEVRIVSTADGGRKHTLQIETDTIWVDFCANDTQLVIAGNFSDEIQFIDIETGEVVQSVTVPAEISVFDWNDELRQLAVGANNDIYVWPADDLSAQPTVFKGHHSRVTHLALNRPGEIVMSCSWDGTTRIFDLHRKKEAVRIEGSKMTKAGFDESGYRMGFTGTKNSVGIWKLPDDRPEVLLRPDSDPSRFKPEFHPQLENLLFYSLNDGIGVWDHIQQRLVGKINLGTLTRLQLSDDGNSVYAGGPNGLQKIELKIDKNERGFVVTGGDSTTIFESDVRDFNINEKQKRMVIRHRSDHALSIDMETGEQIEIGKHTRMARSVISEDGRYIYTSNWQGGNGVYVWDAQHGTLDAKLVEEWSTSTIACSPNSDQFVVLSGFKKALFEANSTDPLIMSEREQPDGWAGAIAYSPDGKMVAGPYSRYEAQLLDSSTMNMLAILKSASSVPVGGMDFSHTGRYLAVAEKDQISVWDLVTVRSRLKEVGFDWRITPAASD